jgi:Domain of unknown function (DUF5658)
MDHNSMGNVLAIPAPAVVNTWVQRLVDWVVAARSHRVICLIGGLWLIGAFDVVLTLLAYRQGLLDESNPIARLLLAYGPHVVLLYKILLVSFASVVLIIYRRKFLAEIAAGGMLFIYTIVAVQWRLCYELYFITHTVSVSTGSTNGVDISELGRSLIY